MKYIISCSAAMDYEVDANSLEEARWSAIAAFLSDVGDAVEVETDAREG